MRWFPYLGFVDLDLDSIQQLGLDTGWEWRGFVFEWFTFGWLFFVQPMRQKVRVK